jgi:hypothetical protein
MGGWRRWLLLVVVALLALAGATYGGLAASTSRSQLARAVLWGESDVDDYRRFPARRIAAGPDRLGFQRPAAGSRVAPGPVRRIGVWEGTRQLQWELERFLAARGKFAQHLYVVPDADLVLVRLGRDNGYPTGRSCSATWQTLDETLTSAPR